MQNNMVKHHIMEFHVARMNAITEARNPVNTTQQVSRALQDILEPPFCHFLTLFANIHSAVRYNLKACVKGM